MKQRLFAALLFAAPFTAAAFALPPSARAQLAPAPRGTAAVPTPAPVPTIRPSAIPTLPPASSSLQLPYPAVGTPAPNVTASVVDPNVPQVITLRQAILIGVAKSPFLASARGDLQLAKANVDLARVPILPNLSGVASVTKSHRQPGSLTSSTTGQSFLSSTDVTQNSLSADLRQLLFDGGKVFAQIRSASASQVSFVDIYQRDLQTLAFNVATAYYNALSAQRTTAVLNETLQQNQVQENLILAQYRAGQASLVDIATAEVPVAQARVNLVRQQGVEAANQAALANAMGLDANTIVRPADDAASYQDVIASAIAIPSYDRAITQAYMLRPDLSSAAQIIEAARYTLRSASLGHMPNVTGNASAGTASTDAQGGTFRNSWSIGATMTIPLYDGGLTHANVEQAQGNLAKATANYDTTKLGIQLNVKQTLTALISARAALDATQTEYNLASTVLRATQAQYRAGVTTLPLLLNAQVQLTTALTDQVNAIYTLRQAEQAFLYAIGQNT
jgi:outer membrane protein